METRLADSNRREIHNVADRLAMQHWESPGYIIATEDIPDELLQDEKKTVNISDVGKVALLTRFFKDGVIGDMVEWVPPFELPSEVDPTIRDEIHNLANLRALLEEHQLSLKIIETVDKFTAKYQVRDKRHNSITCVGRLDALVLPENVAEDNTLSVAAYFQRTLLFVEVESGQKGEEAAVTQCLMSLAVLAHQYSFTEVKGLVIYSGFQTAKLLRYKKSSAGGSYEVDGEIPVQHIPFVLAQLKSMKRRNLETSQGAGVAEKRQKIG
eukprot:5496369-Amphidinium_carterae.1